MRRARLLAVGARPDEDRALGVPHLLFVELVEDLGAVPSCGPNPEVDDRRALDDRLVAEDDDDVGVADR
jgi:hypothetical protein